MIQLELLNKSFDSKIVLENFSAAFPNGMTTCIFGPSGCGKTTLMKILCGLLCPDSGEIFGIDPKGKKSVIFQEDRLLPQLTALSNVTAVCSDMAAVEGALRLAELWDDRNMYPFELSGGMQRRLAIARAAAYNGSLFLMDEPFRGIDWERKERIIIALKKRLEGKTCIYITHDQEEAALFSDQILYVKGPPLALTEERAAVIDKRWFSY